MRQRVLLLHGAALLAALCCSLSDAAAKQTATVGCHHHNNDTVGDHLTHTSWSHSMYRSGIGPVSIVSQICKQSSQGACC